MPAATLQHLVQRKPWSRLSRISGLRAEDPWLLVGIRFRLRQFNCSLGTTTQRFSNYKNWVIATSVHGYEGEPFAASFVIISRKVTDGNEEVVHSERLGSTFAYSGDARAAANRAAQAYVDSHTPLAP